MQRITKLAIFDIDGTLVNHGIFPDSVIAGLKHLQKNGYATTVSTGRGFIRLKQTLGNNFHTVVSSNAPMIIEHGAKIVDRTGKVMTANYLAENEIDHIVDFTRANIEMIKLVRFYPPDPTSRIQVWCYYPNDIKEETEKRGHHADIFSCSFEELKARLLAQPLSNVTAKLKDYIKVQNLKLHFTRSEINTIFQDGYMDFVKNIANKAVAIHYIEENYKVPNKNILVAGNAINDVEMLNLEVGKRILVGNKEELSTVLGYLTNPENVVIVKSPKDLGLYLQKMT